MHNTEPYTALHVATKRLACIRSDSAEDSSDAEAWLAAGPIQQPLVADVLGTGSLTEAEIGTLPLPAEVDDHIVTGAPLVGWDGQECLPVGAQQPVPVVPDPKKQAARKRSQRSRGGGDDGGSSSSAPSRPARRHTMVACQVGLDHTQLPEGHILFDLDCDFEAQLAVARNQCRCQDAHTRGRLARTWHGTCVHIMVIDRSSAKNQAAGMPRRKRNTS